MKIYALCCEMMGKKDRGEEMVKRIEKKRPKSILNVKISTLRRKHRLSFLEEILAKGCNFSEEGHPIIVVPASAL